MPTNNPNQPSSTQPAPRGATSTTDAAANRIDQGGRRVEGTIERAEKGAEQLATEAIDRVRQAREQATSGIVEQRDQIAHRIHKIGTLLRSGGETLAEEDPLAQSVFDYVGDQADGLARYVRDATPSRVADDLQSLARRRPGVFFGGAFLIGLAAGRFIKSSASQGGGGRRDDVERYAEPEDLSDDYAASYASVRERPMSAAVGGGYSAPRTDYAPPSTGTSLPYVSASGSNLGVAPSSATYGASTSSGTSGGSESGAPAYGNTTVGGTGGYAAQPGSTAPVVTRPSRPPALREAPDEPANPRPHAVREGEGSKS